ncbi:hypothetical protein Cgig2_004673 [Carnegiea gigantea]|uniref:Uncharacterized protein n=1 Tax=Carnegiea gigantea TaxID=171969 RepID=A0A9Q1Q9R7_9CARY|nr:hypothetical protein Cgig2_004673 [Carnegiea gigantea]
MLEILHSASPGDQEQVGEATSSKLDIPNPILPACEQGDCMRQLTIPPAAPAMEEVSDEKGVIQQQGIVFEWKPIICKKCKRYGHDTDQCIKENGTMVWIPKAIQPANEAMQQPDEQEWTKVGSNKDSRITAEPGQLTTPIRNNFEALNENDNPR